jgi:hypothetical protein
MARNKDLDADALYRCQDHTNLLVEDIDLGLLWDEYGIVGDLIVSSSITVNHYFIHRSHQAVHKRFPAGRHLHLTHTRHLAPTN